MNIFVVIQENRKGSFLICAEMDKGTALNQLNYHKSISNDWFRLAEIELTNKRLSVKK